MTADNKERFTALLKLTCIVVLALLWFEYIPVFFELIMGDVLKSTIKIVTVLITFLVLTYGLASFKKTLDAIGKSSR